MPKLRVATLEDCEAIRAIYRPYVEDTVITFELETPSHDAFYQRMRGIMDFFPYLVAEVDGEIVGYAYAHFLHERAAYRYNAELTVYLKQDCVHRGIGSLLFAALISLLRAQGFYKLFSLVTAHNEASEALHRKFGFGTAVRFEDQGFKLGEWHDVTWYELRIRKPDGEPKPLRAFCELPAEFVAEVLAHPEALLPKDGQSVGDMVQ